MAEFIQITTSTDNKKIAEKISMAIVENRLAACIQISGPVKSIYWWKDKIERDMEWIITMKTRKDLYPKLEQAIKNLHTYETPEIIAVPIVEGSTDYLDWLEKETGS